ncbi:Gfo/Idh/MocA family oxidoreductase [Algicola sagamiensis]|uniref:Gfo/Idh/MocA family oxidoreductase n=1 Tax=Algicola sagamiensis TaxID=163869 RepID=UPI000374E5D6|nr:Gfo/Idh/MocA family oxidoreductase [Algicola sagamiensis]
MKRIGLIGAGQLGSRHLQSLVSLGPCAEIFVVEPNGDAIETAAIRVAEVAQSLTQSSIAHFSESMASLPEKLDFCIVATGAKSRYSLFEQIVQQVEVKNFLLEKVLFQDLASYEHARHLVKDHHLKVWVNCPRRLFRGYARLKMYMQQDIAWKMSVTGGQWGLACNAIHFIDLFAFLTERVLERVDCGELHQKLFESQRADYIEFNGTLQAYFDRGHQLSMSCEETDEPVEIRLQSEQTQIIIREDLDKATILKKGQDSVHIPISPRYQSELTGGVVQNILSFGCCKLPTIQESSQLHYPLIRDLLSFYRDTSGDQQEFLPIT